MARRRIVVVGGGTSGSVLATWLSGHTDYEIVVVEPGRASPHDDAMQFLDVLADSSLQRLHEVRLTKNSPVVPYVQARALGGGSAINGMLLTDQVPDVAAGLVSEPQHNEIGPVGDALRHRGGRVSQLWWNNGRWNPGRALQHVVDEGRISLMNTESQTLLHNDGVIAGVNTVDAVIECDVVVMCAGALMTPHILQKSGCDAVVRGIGEGLQDHPAITFALSLRDTVSGVCDAAVIAKGKTSDHQEFMHISYERASWSESHLGLLSTMLLTPTSRGDVRTIDNELSIDFNMLDTEQDRRAMREAVRSLIDVAMSDEVQSICDAVFADDQGNAVVDLQALDDQGLDAWISTQLRPVSHCAASCSQVVRNDGNVDKFDGLIIADASGLAHVPSGTPAGPVTMNAMRIARKLQEVLQ